MNQNNLQNHQNDPTFSNLQSTVIQPEHSSSNTNYNDMNVIPSDNIFPPFYTNTNNSDQQSTSNEYTASPLSYDPQYVNPQHPITSINPSQSEILSFDIPGFKII
ncbi:hypothetical protein RhiirA4_478942, partial [Rhizophagus irregularis]